MAESKRFKTYYNEDEGEEVEFTVFKIHGHSKELLAQKVIYWDKKTVNFLFWE